MTVHNLHWHDPFPGACQGGALTVGNFDGVHRGHQELLRELHSQAAQVQGPAVVLTFDPHPLELLRPASAPPLLTTPSQRAELLRQHGADQVIFLRTTPDLLQLSARAFFEQVIQQRLQPRVVVPGFNFAFGHNREGTVATLEAWCRSADIRFVLVAPLQLADEAVSSSRVRSALQHGNVARAAELLGRPYRLQGVVGRGKQRGATIGFPTANLEQIATLLPADGVYAVRVGALGGSWPGAANIGSNPTFGEHARKIEVHLIDFSGDLYGQPLSVDFAMRLRETRPFAGVAQLVEQLRHDVAEASRLLTRWH